jgi:hypothetical protein
VLLVPLPAGLYTLTLNAELVVDGSTACAATAASPRPAWVDSVKPPLIGVTSGQVTRVKFRLVSADPPQTRAGHELGSASARPSPSPCSRSDWHAAEARLGLPAI